MYHSYTIRANAFYKCLLILCRGATRLVGLNIFSLFNQCFHISNWTMLATAHV